MPARKRSKSSDSDAKFDDVDVIMTHESDSENAEFQPKEESSNPKSKKPKKSEKEKPPIKQPVISKISPMRQAKLPMKKQKICDVCFQIVNSPIPDPGYDIIECEKCKLMAHRGTPLRLFTCKRCENGETSQKCMLCHQQSGLMTWINENKQYVHVICAIMSDFFEIEDYGTMTFKMLISQEHLDQQIDQQDSMCSFCMNKDGFLLKCLKKNCKLAGHAYCIQMGRKQYLEKDPGSYADGGKSSQDPDMQGWEVEFRLQDYTMQSNYCPKADSFRIIKEPDFFDEIEIKSPQKSILEQNSPNSLENQKGGKISIVCFDHRNEPKHCFCNQILNDQKLMIQCDHCKMWYHGKCVGMASKEIKEIEEYACQKCKDWAEQRIQFILPTLENPNINKGLLFIESENKLQYKDWKTWNNEILPLERYRLKLIDMIIISNIWSKQALQISHYSISSEMIKQQLIRAQYIPLNLGSQVSILNDKIQTVITYEKTIEELFDLYSFYDIKLVLHINDQVKLEQHIAHNKGIIDKLKCIIEKEENEFMLKSLRCEDLENFLNIISYNLLLYDVRTKPEVKITMEKLEYIKKQYQKADQVHHYKSEFKSYADQLLKEGRDFLHQINDCIKPLSTTVPEGAPLSLIEIIKRSELKKDIIWVNYNIIVKSELTKIDFSNELAIIKQEIAKVREWESQKQENENIQQWVGRLMAINNLKFRSEVIDEEIKNFNENEFWINKYLRIIDFSNRKTNTIQDLQKLQQFHESQDSKIILYHQVKTELLELKNKIHKIQDEFSFNLTKDQLKELRDQSRKLTVRPQPAYENLKVFFNLLKWLDNENEKPIPITRIEAIKNEILDPERKNAIQTKLDEAHEIINTKLRPVFEKIRDQPETIDRILNDINNLEKQKKLLEYNQKVSTDEIPDYTNLKAWFTKIQSTISKTKMKASPYKNIEDYLNLVKKDEIPKLISSFHSSFVPICSFAKNIYQILNSIKNSKECTEALQNKNKKINMKKLESIKSKLEKNNDTVKLTDINQQIYTVNNWYADFKQSCQLTEAALRKELKTNPEKILKKAHELIERRNSLRLEITSNEAKQLERARKWAQLVVDSNIIMTDKQQSSIDLDRIYDIQKEMERIKSLDNDIDSVRQLRQEFLKIEEWHQELDKVTQYDADGIVITVDRSMLRTLIQKAKNEIKINILEEINEIEDQIRLNEEWEQRMDNLLQNGYEHYNQAQELIECIENDKDEVYNLIDKNQIRQLKIWYVKAKYKEQINLKPSVDDFIKALDKDIIKIPSYATEEELSQELEMINLAKRLRESIFSHELQRGAHHHDETINFNRALTLEDCENIIERKEYLPFKIDMKLIDKLQQQRDYYYSTLVEKVENLYQQIPQIQEYDRILQSLKSLQFITPHERFIDKMKKNYEFINQKLDEYPPLPDENLKLSQSQKKEETNEQEEEEANPRFVSDFMKVHKKFGKLRCQCPQAERLIQEYLKARKEFDTIKESFGQHKIQGNFTFGILSKITSDLMKISLDFEDEELQFRQELWHQRIQLLLNQITKSQKPIQSSQQQALSQSNQITERISSESIRYWLEEGQELEVVNDIKYEKLNEVVEDIDHITRALKMCATMDEVEQIDINENQGLIEINHLIKRARERVARGDIPKYVIKSNQNRQKGQMSCALEYLKNSRMKMKGEDLIRISHGRNADHGNEDVEMENMDQDEDEDEDMDTDLDDEREDDIVPDDDEMTQTNQKSKKAKKKSQSQPKKKVNTQVSKIVEQIKDRFQKQIAAKSSKKREIKQANKAGDDEEEGEQKKKKKPAAPRKKPEAKGQGDANEPKKKIVAKKSIGNKNDKKEDDSGAPSAALASKIARLKQMKEQKSQNAAASTTNTNKTAAASAAPSNLAGGLSSKLGGLKGKLQSTGVTNTLAKAAKAKKKFESPNKKGVILSQKSQKEENNNEEANDNQNNEPKDEETAEGSEENSKKDSKKGSLLMKRPLSIASFMKSKENTSAEKKQDDSPIKDDNEEEKEDHNKNNTSIAKPQLNKSQFQLKNKAPQFGF